MTYYCAFSSQSPPLIAAGLGSLIGTTRFSKCKCEANWDLKTARASKCSFLDPLGYLTNKLKLKDYQKYHPEQC
jgi:hypothetical protein